MARCIHDFSIGNPDGHSELAYYEKLKAELPVDFIISCYT